MSFVKSAPDNESNETAGSGFPIAGKVGGVSRPYRPSIRTPGIALARLIVTGRGIDEMRNVMTAALLLVGVSLVAQGRSASTLPPHPPPGQLIDLGGRRLHPN